MAPAEKAYPGAKAPKTQPFPDARTEVRAYLRDKGIRVACRRFQMRLPYDPLPIRTLSV
jgi:hypothetical protein